MTYNTTMAPLWSEAEIERLRELVGERALAADIAAELGRSLSAVESRIGIVFPGGTGRTRGGEPRDVNVRFWDLVDVREPHECWEWQGQRNQRGYGRFSVHGKLVAAHRFAWALAAGTPVPDDMAVRHQCDNRPCVNHRHLVLGTNAQNSGDMVERERSARGERSPRAKLTAEQVADIRLRREGGELVRVLAAEYGVAIGTISMAASGKNWGHVS